MSGRHLRLVLVDHLVVEAAVKTVDAETGTSVIAHDDPDAVAKLHQTLAAFSRLLPLLRQLKERADKADESAPTSGASVNLAL